MELIIEKLVYGGEGLARVEGPDGRRKTVFVPFALPGERVEASLVEERPGFARGVISKVIESSPKRTTPPCQYFGECGGCHYQHADYEAQLELKRAILRETVERISKIELPDIVAHPSPALHYRNRTRMRLAVNADGTVALGYFRWGSHSLLPVKECPISSPLINLAIGAVWSVATQTPIPNGLREIEFFTDHDDQKILIEFLTRGTTDSAGLRAFAEKLKVSLPAIVGVVEVAEIGRSSETAAAPELDGSQIEGRIPLAGESSLLYEAAGHRYQVSAGSFFQTNRFLVNKLVELACGGAAGKHAVDLYAGAGLFTAPLAAGFDRVTAVEASTASFEDLRKNVPSAKTVKSTTETFLERSRPNADFVIVDPPRSGLGRRVAGALCSLRSRQIRYVSCDPSTLARDLTALTGGGYRVVKADLVDLFPQTYHIESVLRLER
jgi:23S rRNA (uracil1939-C5)-methyltransferase